MKTRNKSTRPVHIRRTRDLRICLERYILPRWTNIMCRYTYYCGGNAMALCVLDHLGGELCLYVILLGCCWLDPEYLP